MLRTYHWWYPVNFGKNDILNHKLLLFIFSFTGLSNSSIRLLRKYILMCYQLVILFKNFIILSGVPQRFIFDRLLFWIYTIKFVNKLNVTKYIYTQMIYSWTMNSVQLKSYSFLQQPQSYIKHWQNKSNSFRQ